MPSASKLLGDLVSSAGAISVTSGVANTAITGTITTAQIADSAITTAKVANASIVTVDIADGNVTAAKLANTAVTAGVYGGSSNSALITVDSQGRITAASNVSATAGGLGGITAYATAGSYTFTIPSGKTVVKATAVGGGGGSGQAYSQNGGAGASSTIASGTQSITTLTATGGGGTNTSGRGNGADGAATNFDLNISSGMGSFANGLSGYPCQGSFTTSGGNPSALYNTFGKGSGNSGGGCPNQGAAAGASGGAGGTGVKYLTGLTPGNTLAVVVGGGGTAGGGTAGVAGLVIFEY